MKSPYRQTIVLSLLSVTLCAAWVHAHGPQVQIGIQDGRIVTRALFPDEPYDGSVTPNQRVYEIPMAQRSLADANDGWYAQPNGAYPWTGPGIAVSLGGFATGSILSVTFTDGLKIWDGVEFVDPGTEQIDVYRGAAHTAGAITTDTFPFQSFSFTAISGGADEHKTAFARLLGDGVSPNTSSDDGVYLLTLRLLTNEPGVTESMPYYFLLNKNASPGEAAAAFAYLNAHLVPDAIPVASQWGILAMALALLTSATLLLRGRGRGAVAE